MGSEMCIRDSALGAGTGAGAGSARGGDADGAPVVLLVGLSATVTLTKRLLVDVSAREIALCADRLRLGAVRDLVDVVSSYYLWWRQMSAEFEAEETRGPEQRDARRYRRLQQRADAVARTRGPTHAIALAAAARADGALDALARRCALPDAFGALHAAVGGRLSLIHI